VRGGPGVEVVSHRRDDIQGLRALAVGLVVAAHLGVAGMSGGFIGVDVFFVISGFLITGVLLREHAGEDGISLRGFFTRRAQRILPAAIVVSAAILVVAGLTQSSVQVRQYLHDALWSAGFLENKHLVDQATDYFATNATSPFQHFWSLSVEEQFYLVWPFALLLLLRALDRRVVLVVIATVVALSVLASVSLTVSSPDQAYFATYTRAFELGLGALLALGVVLGGWRMPAWFAWVGGLVGITLIVVSALVMDGTGFPGWHALVPTLGATALLAAGLQRQVGVNRLLGLAPLRWLGDISYSLYLWHFPIIVLGRPLLPEQWSNWQQAVALLAVSLLAAEFTYRLVEQPLLRWRHTRFRGLRPLIWWPVAFTTVMTVAFGSSAYAEHRQAITAQHAVTWYAQHSDACPDGGLSASASVTLATVRTELDCAQRLVERQAPVPAGVRPDQVALDSFDSGPFCWDHTVKAIVGCAADLSPDRPDLVVVGDSHMGHWLPAFQRIAEDRGLDFVPFVRAGCPIWDLPTAPGGKDGNDPACGAYRADTLRQIATLHPAVIVVTSLIDVRADDASDPVGNGWRTAIHQTVDKLTELTPKVVVLADTPLRPTAVPACLGAPGNGLAGCDLTRSPAQIGTDSWLERTVEAAGLRWVDPTVLICRDDACPAVAAGIGMYSDDSHITRTWSAHVAPALDELLDQAGAFSG